MSMSLTHEPASEPLHVSVKWFYIACVQGAFALAERRVSGSERGGGGWRLGVWDRCEWVEVKADI